MNKYEVGYIADDSPMGIYYGETEEEAIQECRDDICSAKLRGYNEVLSARERMKGMVAYKVDY